VQFPLSHVNSVSFEKDEPTIWLSGAGGAGLFRFNFETNELKNYKNLHSDAETQKMRNSVINTLSFGRFLLMATNQGMWRFDQVTEKFSRPKCDPNDSALFYYPSSFNFIMSSPGSRNADSNDLWVAFLGKEMVRVDSNLTITNRDSSFRKDLTFSLSTANNVLGMLEDHENLWVSSFWSGVNRIALTFLTARRDP